ncbi:hypothetical protein Cfor_00567 [Coptotermes formosanus]|uniref:Uncharacterized protein n=1 Tax=Coptotermes formosanus TaxID=36987 RepID=A0A6L2Q8Q2_COPFO|nr:hypothetical protein Cfor_00567 [Coptotermes formosanus]
MIIATLFWDSKDVLHLDFLAGKKTINAEYYSNLLNESEAENTLKVKKVAGFSLLPPRQCSSSHCRFNDDNSTETEVGFLRGKRCQNNGDVIAGVQCWIQKPLKTFFKTGIKKLPQSWHKCTEVSVDYNEK